MARPTMRRLSPLVLAILFLLGSAPPFSSAQESPQIRLTLLSQTPWNSATDRELALRFRAENVGNEPLGELAIGVTLYSRVLSRSAYEASLVTDPPLLIDGQTLPREGTLEPGETRDFEIAITMDVFGIDADHSGVYPVKVDLRSGENSIAVLRTPAIFLVREPETPLALSWTFVLHHPITFGPDGTFSDASLEESLDAGGRLHGEIRALLELAADPNRTPVDVAVSPVLLTQLGRMHDGYVVSDGVTVRRVSEGEGGAALASQAIEDLREIAAAPGVRITALPFAAPELPSLYGGALERDARVQLERGQEITSSFMETTTQNGTLRPPGAALDDETLRGVAASGISTLILGPQTVVVPEQPLGFAGPATTRLDDEMLTGIVPDAATDAVLGSIVADDPVLAAQVLLGELATIWQEQPGEERGIALVMSEDAPLPGPFFDPLVRGVAGAPWLEPMGAGEFVAAFPPTETSDVAVPSLRRFAPSYAVSLKQARRRVDTLRSMLPAASDAPLRLETMLLLAEARQFLVEPSAGLAFIEFVRASVRDEIDALTLDTVSSVTLTSESGGIPVTVSNEGEQPLRFSVRLVSRWLRESPSADLELRPGDSETLRLQAQLRSAGRFLVLVQMLSPNGRLIGQREVTVRSTAYNRMALLITIGAALVLLVLWARRFVPRRTT